MTTAFYTLVEAPPPDAVDTPSIAYRELSCRWDLIDDLWGGTLAMRNAGVKWLPQEPRETPENYGIRLGRAVLFNAFKDTVVKLAARPFSKPITYSGQLPEKLQAIVKDTDRTKKPLADFAQEVLVGAIRHGRSHILVDFPQMPADATAADEKRIDVRPTFIHVPATALIGADTVANSDGTERITRIRIKETKHELDGQYRQRSVNYVRVYTETTWELWKEVPYRESRDAAPVMRYMLAASGVHSFGAVPLVTLYARREGDDAVPPLEDLAWLNLSHWQESADQKNALRFARIGILFAAGFTDEEVEKGVTISPNALTSTSNPEAKLMYVEHSGAAIGLGRQSILDTEERMVLVGLQPLMQRTGGVSATGRAIDEGKNLADLQVWVHALELTLRNAFEMAGKWLNITVPEDFKIDIFSDFAISPRARDDILALIEMRALGEIDRKTLLTEVRRRALIGEDTDIDAVIKAAKEEGPIGGGTGSPRLQTGFGVPKPGGADGGASNRKPDNSDPANPTSTGMV